MNIQCPVNTTVPGFTPEKVFVVTFRDFFKGKQYFAH